MPTAGKTYPPQSTSVALTRDYTGRLEDGMNFAAPANSYAGYFSQYAPPAGINGIFWMKFTVKSSMTLSKVYFQLDTAGTDNNAIAFHVYKYVPTAPDASKLQQVCTTGSKTGFLNSAGFKTVPFNAPGVVTPGFVYYFAMGIPGFQWTGTTKPSFPVLVCSSGLPKTASSFPWLFGYSQGSTDAAGAATTLSPGANFNPAFILNWVYPFDIMLGA